MKGWHRIAQDLERPPELDFKAIEELLAKHAEFERRYGR